MQWIMRLWRKRQRKIDIDILWPVCKRTAHGIDQAIEGFNYHVRHDPAWSDLTDLEIKAELFKLRNAP